MSTRPTAALDRLNPVARLGCALVLALPVLVTLDWVSSVVLLGAELIVFTAAGISPAWLARRLLPVMIVAVIAGISMSLYGRPGGVIHFHWWLIVISDRSLLMGLAVCLRVLALACAAVVLLARIDPTLMADGLAQIVRLPARFVLGTLAGVRLIGLLADDWRTLHLARRARGLGDSGRIRRFASMAFALLVVAIRRATTLATAMEVRGFSTANVRARTWARPSRLGGADVVGLVAAVAIDAAAIGAALVAGTFWLIWWGAPS